MCVRLCIMLASSRGACLYPTTRVRAAPTCSIPTPVGCIACALTTLFRCASCKGFEENRQGWWERVGQSGRKKPDRDSFWPDSSGTSEWKTCRSAIWWALWGYLECPWARLSLCGQDTSQNKRPAAAPTVCPAAASLRV